MITSQHLQQLDRNTEGDFLFIVKSTLAPITHVIDGMVDKQYKGRTCHFVCSETSPQYGKLMDLSNKLKNNGFKSFLYKGKFSDYKNDSSYGKLALVYFEPCEYDTGNEVFSHLHKSLSTGALIVYKSVDYSSISDYINDNRLNQPQRGTQDFFRWSNLIKSVKLNTTVKRSKSNNF
tara:strand:+ start:1676 stop:2206 length:531 start_codon:yes stop_codon:yes gene_type:complete